jgi:hypothetical protein
MILFFFPLLISLLWSAEPLHWNYLISLEDRHEFYESSTLIDRPKNSWQVLFSLTYVDKSLNYVKDCVFYRVPGDNPGVLKIKALPFEESCERFIFGTGDQEMTGIKSLQFHLSEKEVTIDFSTSDFKATKWSAIFHTTFDRPEARMHLSSAEFKSPKIIYLAPENINVKKLKESLIEDQKVCHDINDECEEVTSNSCSQCKHGWFEVPNGCPTGPKICGSLDCGKKNGPACRRGNRWQRKDSTLDCRTDSSFAYCGPGLQITCEGRKAFCR